MDTRNKLSLCMLDFAGMCRIQKYIFLHVNKLQISPFSQVMVGFFLFFLLLCLTNAAYLPGIKWFFCSPRNSEAKSLHCIPPTDTRTLLFLSPPPPSPVSFRPQMRFPESRHSLFMLWTQWLWARSKRDYHIITGVIRASFVAHVAQRGLGSALERHSFSDRAFIYL